MVPVVQTDFPASISGASAGLGCQAEWQRGEGGLIGRGAVKLSGDAGHYKSPSNGSIECECGLPRVGCNSCVALHSFNCIRVTNAVGTVDGELTRDGQQAGGVFSVSARPAAQLFSVYSNKHTG